MQRSSKSPCSKICSGRVGYLNLGDFGCMNCGYKRHYSQRQVTAADLPVSISMRCDSSDNIHAGFDSVKSRTKAEKMPYGTIECQNGKVILDTQGTKKASDRPCHVGREGGQSLVIGGPSLVMLEGNGV